MRLKRCVDCNELFNGDPTIELCLACTADHEERDQDTMKQISNTERALESLISNGLAVEEASREELIDFIAELKEQAVVALRCLKGEM